MEQITAAPTMQTGAASYPPNYNAVGARLDRAWPRYIKARVRDDQPLVNLTRALLVDPSGLRGAKRAAANMLNKQGRA